MTATAKWLLRMIDSGRIMLDQIAETAKWQPYKAEVETEIKARSAEEVSGDAVNGGTGTI